MFSPFSSAVQQCLMTSSVWEAIRAVNSMAALHARLEESGCSHLQDFLRETLIFWHKIVKDRLTRYTVLLARKNKEWFANVHHCISFFVFFVFVHSLYMFNPLQFFCSDFEKVLTQLHWPIICPPTQSLTPAASYPEINSQLELLVTQLLALQTTYPSVCLSTHLNICVNIPCVSFHLSVPIHANLIKCFEGSVNASQIMYLKLIQTAF